VTIGFLVTSLTKALLLWFLSLAEQPALGRVLLVTNFFHLRKTPLCSWEPSTLLKCFCASTQSCLGALRTIPSTSWLGLCSDMHCQLWDLI
jgi:hypothetical protein